MNRAPQPIADALPTLMRTLADSPRVVLVAPTGAGKTTVVPPALVGERWCTGRVIVLEPRRLAARAAARFMARERGERVGETIGFRVRGEAAVSSRTRVEVVTEGVLTRMIASDPTLDGVSAVLFDEFHERSLIADTGLALTIQSAELVRPDLRIIVMSATLDAGSVATLLGGAPVVESRGRQFPVTTEYVVPRDPRDPVADVANAVLRGLGAADGDVLVFLPGAAEIHRAAQQLTARDLPPRTVVHELAGHLTADAQDAAVAPAEPGTRKVVLATAIAETSLTIEGVRCVIDAGLARGPRYDPGSGMTRLVTTRVTADAADQRRGRAGRTAPGHCIRLWHEAETATLRPARTPEIRQADLAPLALDLALAGERDPSDLHWLDPPPAAAYATACTLLQTLDILDDARRPTAHAEQVARLGLHPRLGHMVARSTEMGPGATAAAAALAAIVSERDIVQRDGPALECDVAPRLDAVLHGPSDSALRLDRGRLHRVRDEARRIRERAPELRAPSGSTRPMVEDAVELLALAYPDRVALRRPGARGRFVMATGAGVRVDERSAIAGADAIIVAVTDGAADDALVVLAAATSRVSLERLFGHQMRTEVTRAFDLETGRVVETTERRLGALVFGSCTRSTADPDAVADAIVARVRASGVGAIPWSEAAVRLRERLTFLHRHSPAQWPAVDDAALLERLEQWLPAVASRCARWTDLERADLVGALLSLVPSAVRGSLDRLAPTHFVAPTGSRVPVDYRDAARPMVAVRVQELFGLRETPTILSGAVPLTLSLLSPASRPIQVTRDLPGFWAGSWTAVRKSMRGEYPRHEWPEDPASASPTRRAKPRSSPGPRTPDR